LFQNGFVAQKLLKDLLGNKKVREQFGDLFVPHFFDILIDISNLPVSIDPKKGRLGNKLLQAFFKKYHDKRSLNLISKS